MIVDVKKRCLLKDPLSACFQDNAKALEWHRIYLLRNTIVRNLTDQITNLEVDIKNKDETISLLKHQIKSNPSINFDHKMSKVLQQISDLEIKLKESQAQCKSLEFIIGDNIPNIALPTSPITSFVVKSTKSPSLAIQNFSTTTNSPSSLNEKVVGKWCRKVKFEMMRYFDNQQRARYLQCINEYATKIQRLEREKYLLQKRIADLERQNKTLKGANKALNRDLKAHIKSISDADYIKKIEKKLK